MKRNLTQAVFVAVAVFSLVGLAAKAESASPGAPLATELGEFCWSLDPFIDTIKVVIVQSDTDPNVNSFSGRWVAAGTYSFAIDGSLVANDVEGNMDFQFTAVNLADPTTFPNSWVFHAKVNAATQNGNWKFKRDDGFTNSGTFTFITTGCPAGASPNAGNGATANDGK